MMKKFVVIFLVLLGFQSNADGALYKWVDENGGVHFSDRPQPQPPTPPKGASTPTPANNPRLRSFPVPQHGNLVLEVPESWDHEIQIAPKGLPPTIVFTPREGDDFEVLITPLFNPKNEPGYNRPEVTKRLITKDRDGMLPTAVEKIVQISEFQGKQGTGYYFLMTDKDPGTGYPYAVRAGIGVGDLLLYVTVLCRTRESEGIRQTLQALQSAVQIKG
jgi:hypothetical protein